MSEWVRRMLWLGFDRSNPCTCRLTDTLSHPPHIHNTAENDFPALGGAPVKVVPNGNGVEA